MLLEEYVKYLSCTGITFSPYSEAKAVILRLASVQEIPERFAPIILGFPDSSVFMGDSGPDVNAQLFSA